MSTIQVAVKKRTDGRSQDWRLYAPLSLALSLSHDVPVTWPRPLCFFLETQLKSRPSNFLLKIVKPPAKRAIIYVSIQQHTECYCTTRHIVRCSTLYLYHIHTKHVFYFVFQIFKWMYRYFMNWTCKYFSFLYYYMCGRTKDRTPVNDRHGDLRRLSLNRHWSQLYRLRCQTELVEPLS